MRLLTELISSIVSIILVFVACLSGDAMADQLSLIPSVSARGAYDDNLLFTSRDEKSDFFTEIRPALAIKQATENSSLNAAAEMNVKSFADETDLNTVDQKFTADAGLRLHPLLKLNIGGSYLKDTTLNEEFKTEGLVLTRNDRKKYTGTTGLGWTAGERTDLNFGVSYEDRDYKSPEFSDYYVTHVYGSMSHRLRNFRTAVLFQPSYYYYKSDISKTWNYQALAGVRHNFTEQSSLQILAGPNFAHSEWFAIREESRSGWVAKIEVKKLYERGSLRAGYTEDITGSGYGETVRRRHPYLSSSFRFSERLRGGLDFNYFRIKTDSEEALRNYETYSAGAGLTYMLGEQAEVRLYYRHSEVDYRLSAREAERNMIYFQIKVYTIKDL